MDLYFAPLEGITDGIFRRTHRERFPGVRKYFIPFVSPTQHLTFSSREQAALSPAENAGVPAVPQILTKNAEHFVHMTRLLRDAGFPEVNLNLGCPSGTVTAKGKGAGMLRDLGELRSFLDTVFAGAALPVSIKTRLGYDSPEEWPALLALLAEYPASEVILHPRTRSEMYRGEAHREAFALALEAGAWPCAYNGDLRTAADCRAMAEEYPGACALMVGRGMVSNPALAREFAGGSRLTLAELRTFHDALFEAYSSRWPANAVLGHMHETAQYFADCFTGAAKQRKAIRKAASVKAYLEAVDRLFGECAMAEEPAYRPEEH